MTPRARYSVAKAADEPWFVLNRPDNEYPAHFATRYELLDTRHDDADLCAWLASATIGDECVTRGATGELLVRRVA